MQKCSGWPILHRWMCQIKIPIRKRNLWTLPRQLLQRLHRTKEHCWWWRLQRLQESYHQRGSHGWGMSRRTRTVPRRILQRVGRQRQALRRKSKSGLPKVSPIMQKMYRFRYSWTSLQSLQRFQERRPMRRRMPVGSFHWRGIPDLYAVPHWMSGMYRTLFNWLYKVPKS